MNRNNIREMLKIVGVILAALALFVVIMYFKIAGDKSVIKSVASYSTEVKGDAEHGYTMDYTFEIEGDSVSKTFNYETEPFVGKTETVYYVKGEPGKIYVNKDDINLYKTYSWLAGVAGALLIAAVISFCGFSSIRPRRNARNLKKIKVDEKSLIK